MPTLTTDDGRTLAWRARGSGPPLLCHPGGPGSSSAYFGDLAELAAERSLLLLDPRGTGGSDRPSDPSAYDLEDYAADIEAVRGHLGIEQHKIAHHHGMVTHIYNADPCTKGEARGNLEIADPHFKI